MTDYANAASAETLAALEVLVDREGPLLVETQFPGMGTSSDWYLLNTIEEIRELLERMPRGAILVLEPVWELKNPKNSGMKVRV